MSVETYTYHQARQPKRDVGGWMEKRHRIESSRVSPSQFGVIYPGGQARVKPRPVPPPQDLGGRCRGTGGQDPQVVARKSGMPAPHTRLQHLVDSEVLLEKKRRSDTTCLTS